MQLLFVVSLAAVAMAAKHEKRATTCAGAAYNVPSFSGCINDCNQKAGQSFFDGYSKDPTSPNLVKSLSYECDSGNPDRTAFMTKAGICMVGCSTEEQNGYSGGYKAMCDWYKEHINDVCVPAETPAPPPVVETPTPTPEPVAPVEPTQSPPTPTSESIAPVEPTQYPPTSSVPTQESPIASQIPEESTSVVVSPTATSAVPSSTCQATPPYTGPTFDSCINNCNEQAGKTFFEGYSKDPNSPNLIKSLSYECDPSNADRTSFMTKAGICMVGCTTGEQDGYTNGYKAMCGWYEQNKLNTPSDCSVVSPTSSSVPTATSVDVLPTTCQPLTVTVTSTVTLTDIPQPTPNPVTCNHGAYACEAEGTSAKFTICVWGKPILEMCAPGTVCKTFGDSIICDWA
ncbi:hypothetical protein K7432_010420 [Basidiobolus ranarum]|uniref:Uncharacterized protein n=1 Tax=Basidiobolus ranarum TaxID=34480 RepID=A0ABR2WNU0_9FUNG